MISSLLNKTVVDSHFAVLSVRARASQIGLRVKVGKQVSKIRKPVNQLTAVPLRQAASSITPKRLQPLIMAVQLALVYSLNRL